jgi:hypothetical protein
LQSLNISVMTHNPCFTLRAHVIASLVIKRNPWEMVEVITCNPLSYLCIIECLFLGISGYNWKIALIKTLKTHRGTMETSSLVVNDVFIELKQDNLYFYYTETIMLTS